MAKTIAIVVILIVAILLVILYRKKLGVVGSLAVAGVAGFIAGAMAIFRGTSRKIDQPEDDKVIWEAIEEQKKSLDKKVQTWRTDATTEPELDPVDPDSPDPDHVDFLEQHSKR
jgi:hypothetical protein